MSGGIKIPEVPAKMTEKFFDDAVPGQEESLYDIPRQTYCTFLGEAQDEIAESDSPIAPPSNEMLLHSGVREQDVGVTRLEVQSPTDLHSGVTSFLVKKPVIADVKIIKHEPGGSAGAGKAGRFLTPPEGLPKESWSAEAINRLEILSNLKDDDLNFRFRNRTSTFVNPANAHAKQSVYIDLGEYQTLLKHDVVTEEASEKDSDNGERPYTLPQPQCYSDDTMKAVHTITQRFDSFKLRQLRVRSFRDAAGHTRRRPSNTSAGRRASNAASVDGSDEEETLDGRRRSELLRQKSSVEEVENAILTERDVYRIEVFYRGQEAEVYVCRCLADVFVGASTKPSEETYHWVQTHTGVPVLLLNTGLGVKPRELILLVAQRDTALPLWQDKINYLSGYHESSPGVHMMKVSGSLSKAIQLRMMEDGAGKAFLDRFSEITSDPDDELWKISGAAEQNQVKDGRRQKKVKSQLSGSRRKRHVTKADISQPCNSTQLTKVDAKDHNFRAAFGDLLPTLKLLVNSGDPSENQDEEFRPRLPTR